MVPNRYPDMSWTRIALIATTNFAVSAYTVRVAPKIELEAVLVQNPTKACVGLPISMVVAILVLPGIESRV